MKNQKRGFTLIELLVVVLIVGILAAVAVPQYQKAVEKSRLAEVWSTLGAIRKAQAVSIYREGLAGLNFFSQLGIDLPCTNTTSNSDGCYVACPSGKWSNCRYTSAGGGGTIPFSTTTNPVAAFIGDYNGVQVGLYLDNEGRHCELPSGGTGNPCAELGVY